MWFDVLKNITRVGLVNYRHMDMPVNDYIWEKLPTGLDEADLSYDALDPLLVTHVEKWLEEKEVDELHLYVTGFTLALIAFLLVWNNRSKLVLYFHDRVKDDYYSKVWS